MQGEIKLNSNETYAIEKQAAIPICYLFPDDAWSAAVNYTGTQSNYPDKIFDNVGWVRGVKQAEGGWGAYLWVIQNRIAFQSSTSAWWILTNNLPVAITNVMVGSLGDYLPMSNVVDIGPHLDAATNNNPGVNMHGEEKEYQVDISNVFYQLSIPDIWITPRETVTCVGGSNVQFMVTGTNIPQGVTWTIVPSGVGAEIYPSNDWHYASVMPGNVGTNYKIRATSVDNTNFYDEVNLTVCKVEMITPTGDPTNAPVDSGDGQNEFTFSTNNPGVLEMNLKAKVIPTGIAGQIASRCQFTVDAIGGSTLTWDSANPNGSPTTSNDFLLAKVTFTGLPVNNAAFGSKKAVVYFDTTKQDEKPYEVFFAKWGYNNPVGGTNNPNWFYYWKEGGVCGIGTNCVFVKTNGIWGYTQPWNDSIIRLCDLAPEENSGPETYNSYRANEGYGEPTNGSITVTGQGKGINCVAETVQHESEHIYIYGTFNGQSDGDSDGIPNSQETTNSATSYGGIASDLANNDTYNMNYGTYSDQELRCRKKEMIRTEE